MQIFNQQDPTEWTSSNIRTWLGWITKKFKIEPQPVFERFPENGQDLVQLSQADFWVCAGSRDGGKILTRHIAHMIHSVTGRCPSALACDGDPGLWSLIEFIPGKIWVVCLKTLNGSFRCDTGGQNAFSWYDSSIFYVSIVYYFISGRAWMKYDYNQFLLSWGFCRRRLCGAVLTPFMVARLRNRFFFLSK